MRRLLFCGLILLTACQDKTKPQDWRVQQIDRAETKIRAEISDPTAQFSKVQLTGDDKTGQTCGEVFPTHGQPQRFIVYIDGAGPFIEGGLGPQPMAQESFDSAWYNDCVSEGYAALGCGGREAWRPARSRRPRVAPAGTSRPTVAPGKLAPLPGRP